MCGIAGIMYKTRGAQGDTGKALIDMLDGCQHRGPDSTGFALYGATVEGRLRLRFFVAEDEDAKAAVDRIKASLAEHGASVVEDQMVGNNYRCTVAFAGDIQKFAYAMFVMSDSALQHLKETDGWEIGSGPSIVVVDKGAAGALTTTTLQDDIYVYFFNQEGLMAGLGLQGTKISRIQPKS